MTLKGSPGSERAAVRPTASGPHGLKTKLLKGQRFLGAERQLRSSEFAWMIFMRRPVASLNLQRNGKRSFSEATNTEYSLSGVIYKTNKHVWLTLKVTRLSPQAWGWTSTVGAGRKLSELLSH